MLFRSLARSAQRASRHVTARAANMPCAPGPNGVAVRMAYDIGAATVLPGEPIRVRLFDLPPGAQIVLPIEAHADSAWLVIDGQVDIGGVPCAALDYQQRRAGASTVVLATEPGARLMLRESQSLRVFRARPSSAFERRPVQAQSAAIAGYGEHLQRRLGVFGRDERA